MITVFVMMNKNDANDEATIAPTQAVQVTDAPTQTPAATAEPRNEAVISTKFVAYCDDWVSLRTNPNRHADTIIRIDYGEPVGYIEPSSNGYYKVNYNGRTGYVLAAYLIDEQPPPKAQTRFDLMRVVNCDEWISLREWADADAEVILTIPLGKEVEYIGDAGNGFYKIRYQGSVGYADSYYLTW